MSTRFYLPSSGAAAVSPTFDSFWDVTGSADRIRAIYPGILFNSSLTDKSASFTDANIGQEVLNRQYVSDPIVAQTISTSSTVKGQVRCAEDNADADLILEVLIKVVKSDLSLRASIGPFNLTEMATSLTNRGVSTSWAGSDTECEYGDRIVFEFGASVGYPFGSFSGTRNLTQRFGRDASFDLPEDDTSTNDYDPWVEFSHTFLFAIPCSGSSAGASSTAAAISHVLYKLAGSSAGGASAVGVIAHVLYKIAGSSAGASSTAAILKYLQKVACSSAGGSSASALLKYLQKFSGLSAGGSSAVALLRALYQIRASSDGASFALGRLRIEDQITLLSLLAQVQEMDQEQNLIASARPQDLILFKDWPVRF